MRRWCSWDSKAGPQDGRCRQNHGAMAATNVSQHILMEGFLHFMSLPKTNCIVIDTVNQGNWCLSIKLRLQCFVFVA